MSITSGLAMFAVMWFLILLMLLPIGVRSQAESGAVERGTSAGAPVEPMMRKKFIWTTIATCVAWSIAFGIIAGGVITREDIRNLAPFDQSWSR